MQELLKEKKSPFDEPAQRHVAVVEMVIEKAKD